MSCRLLARAFLAASVAAAIFTDPSLHAGRPPYYRDPRVHFLGDTALHAGIARVGTRLIDELAYDGEDVRKSLLSCIPRNVSVIDLCCGTGTSTAVPGVGVDTSEHMVREARWRRGRHGRFVVGNAETYGDRDSFDVATLFFCLHEMPRGARRRVLQNAHRISKGRVMMLDIGNTYTPSRAMSASEPYLTDYLENILEDVAPYEPKIHHVVNGRLLFVEMVSRSP